MTIPELIEKTGLTDPQIAVKLNLNALTPYRWRHNQKVPCPSVRKALVKLADVAVSDVEWVREFPVVPGGTRSDSE